MVKIRVVYVHPELAQEGRVFSVAVGLLTQLPFCQPCFFGTGLINQTVDKTSFVPVL